ncbi:hypothetical protein QTO34_007645 [Cnephaeus nilssonii]|uniref:Uncharacterized protein n=1 Tax=Cnephaeus nilssonii TaxID=3371016 RepID=A0AA40HIQ6_CNENI|nr:hypothetical protein QTO34_007645 [Eptesicus nilssonii]
MAALRSDTDLCLDGRSIRSVEILESSSSAFARETSLCLRSCRARDTSAWMRICSSRLCFPRPRRRQCILWNACGFSCWGPGHLVAAIFDHMGAAILCLGVMAVQLQDEALLWLKHMGSTALASPSPVPTVSHDTTLYESKSQRFCSTSEKRKKEGREAPECSKAKKMTGLKAKLYYKQRHAEKIQMKKTTKMHKERNTKQKNDERTPQRALPAYLLDRERLS